MATVLNDVRETTTKGTRTGARLSHHEPARSMPTGRACNYLAAGMIYLRANPLLREPLKAAAAGDRRPSSLSRDEECRPLFRSSEQERTAKMRRDPFAVLAPWRFAFWAGYQLRRSHHAKTHSTPTRRE
jgi:XFP N-terminal domain